MDNPQKRQSSKGNENSNVEDSERCVQCIINPSNMFPTEDDSDSLSTDGWEQVLAQNGDTSSNKSSALSESSMSIQFVSDSEAPISRDEQQILLGDWNCMTLEFGTQVDNAENSNCRMQTRLEHLEVANDTLHGKQMGQEKCGGIEHSKERHGNTFAIDKKQQVMSMINDSVCCTFNI